MKLTVERIVDAGMATFADVGYDGLSMRLVAGRLNAQAGSLYYHVRNKDALLRLMADRVAQLAFDAGSDALAALPATADWQARVQAQLGALRDSVRRDRGGAALLASSPKVLSTGALSLMERLLETLKDAGVSDELRRIAADTMVSHVTGFVLQEQSESPAPDINVDETAALAQRFPMTFAGAYSYDDDELFVQSVGLLCAAIETVLTRVQPDEKAARMWPTAPM